MPDSENELDVFDQILSPEALPGYLNSPSSTQSSPHQKATNTSGDMGIQRKQRSTLQELLESQPGKDVPEKAAQTKLPPPPPIQPPRIDLVYHKRKMEEKCKKVVEAEKTHPPHEVEPQGGLSNREAFKQGQPPR